MRRYGSARAKREGCPVLQVITFKWSQPGYRSKYDATHVNIMQRMVARHYPHPHKFVCITDERYRLLTVTVLVLL